LKAIFKGDGSRPHLTSNKGYYVNYCGKNILDASRGPRDDRDRASVAIRSLVCGLPMSQRSGRVLVMLKAYFDASGTLNQTPQYVLAGYISTVEKWERLSDDWQLALDGPPKIDYFKIREALYCAKQFEGWDPKDAKARARKFRRLITRHVVGGFAVVIPTGLYNKCIRGRIPDEMDHPYFITFLSSVEFACKVVGSMGFAGPIDFVFDTENLDSRARMLLEDFKKWPWDHSEMVGELDFRDDTKVLPLQTADMIAWLLRTELSSGAVQIEEQMSLNVNPPVLVLTRTEEWLDRYIVDFHRHLHQIDPTGALLARWRK
jgi:hypothetical protein